MMSDNKILFHAFKKFMQEIWDDIIFAGLMFVPILVALLFRFGITVLERELCNAFHQQAIISPYYFCLDLVVIMMTPTMFAFSGVMVILGELDNGMAKYLMVTPLGRSGYLWSRVGILSVISMLYSCILVSILRTSDISIPMIFYCGVIAAMIGVVVSFFVVAVAHNKVEGMALTKFSSFFILGIPLSVFIKAPVKYVGLLFPSFWATEFYQTNNISDALLGIATGIFLILLGYKLFKKKI